MTAKRKRKGLSYVAYYISDLDYRLFENVCDRYRLSKSAVARFALKQLIANPPDKSLERLSVYNRGVDCEQSE